MFYLRWIEAINQKGFGAVENQWQALMKTGAWHSWCGYAFEAVCFKHINQIISALNLTNSVIGVSSWRYLPKKGEMHQGAQIDVLLERNDYAFSIVEIKYSDKKYNLDKSTAKNLVNKITAFETQTKTKHQIFMVLITTLGLNRSLWSEDLISDIVTLSDLFN